MIVAPTQLFDQVISNYINKDIQCQQAGVDLTLGKVFYFMSAGLVDFDNKKRKLADVNEIPLSEEPILLLPGVYKIQLNETVKLDEYSVGIFFTRTSLLRNGVSISAGLFDPGFEGNIEMLMTVLNPYGILITKNAKVGQLIIIRNQEKLGKYEGIYKAKDLKK